MDGKVIAIDGPAGSGKSTTAAAVAKRLGFVHLDSGALYRAVTLAALDAGAPIRGQRVVALARSLPVRLRLTDSGVRAEVAGVDVSREIRTTRVTERVSEIAALPEVREWVNAELRAAAGQAPGVVMDGRDIGSVVFPEAGVKVYLTASSTERAQRRLAQHGHADDTDAVAAAERDIMRRDAHDAGRTVAPLVVPDEAVVLDTTGMSFEDQVDRVVGLAKRAFGSLDTVS